ncbi:MAG: hypothetical protein LUE08_00380 [Akkermansiaceae bacterium]|nr:hypothetical protein [Akkermansiaceae bacterium]
MNNILMDKLCEKMLASFGVTGETSSASSLTAEHLREMLDHYFDDIVDGRQAMPKSLCKVLCKAYESFHEDHEEEEDSEGSPMGELWESIDVVRAAPPAGREAKITSLFPGVTPEETMVLRQLGTEKSLSEHAKALGMDVHGMKRIIKRIANRHE